MLTCASLCCFFPVFFKEEFSGETVVAASVKRLLVLACLRNMSGFLGGGLNGALGVVRSEAALTADTGGLDRVYRTRLPMCFAAVVQQRCVARARFLPRAQLSTIQSEFRSFGQVSTP